jgi:putative ABC transport system ATP-binding protein
VDAVITAALSVDELYKSISHGKDTVEILRGITFDLNGGEMVALMGPSGSGKSTLLGIVAGLDRPTSGRVTVAGTEIGYLPESKLASFRADNVGMVFQAYNLIPTLTALENVQLPLLVPGRESRDLGRARTVLQEVGLGHRLNHQPAQLSGGEQQRVAVARALVSEPPLIIADEPTGNLDSDTGDALVDLLLDLRARHHTTILLATHNPAVAERADRILHMHDGRLA